VRKRSSLRLFHAESTESRDNVSTVRCPVRYANVSEAVGAALRAAWIERRMDHKRRVNSVRL